jgi:PadR family transcriptional regulator, regulatory protein PadR
MPDRHTEEAVAEAAPLEAARRVRSLEQQGLVRGEWEHPERRSRRFYRLTDAGEAERRRLAVELGPRDAVAAGIDLIRRELRV